MGNYRTPVLWTGIGLIGIALTASGVIPPFFLLDDGYITARNAGLIASGQADPMFGSPALTGSTSLIHTFLVTAFAFLMAADKALMSATVVGLTLYAAGAWAASARAPDRITQSLLFLTFFAVGSTLLQLVNGMETGLAMAAGLWIGVLATSASHRSHMAAAGLLGLAVFIRPEFAALALLVIPYLAWKSDRRVQIVAAATASFAFFALIAYSSTGSLLSSTVEAKRVWFAEGCAPMDFKAQIIKGVALQVLMLTAPCLLAVAALVRKPWTLVVLGFAAAFFVAYVVRFPGALTHNAGRYIYILFPLVVLILCTAVNEIQRRNVRLTIAALSLAVLSFSAVSDSRATWRFFYPLLHQDIAGMSHWVNQNVPKGSTILVHDVGYLSWVATGYKMTDLVGLKTPESIQVHKDVTLKTCGEKRGWAVAYIAREANPAYAITSDDWNFHFQLDQAIALAGYELTPVYDERYNVYKLTKKPQKTRG